jgi:hypothetical protein
MDRSTISRDWHKQALEDAGLRHMPLVSGRSRRATPCLYTDQEIVALLDAAEVLGTPHRTGGPSDVDRAADRDR